MNCLSKHCLEHTLVPPKLTETTLTLGFPCFSFSPLSFDTSPGQVPATGLNRSPTASLVSIKKKKKQPLDAITASCKASLPQLLLWSPVRTALWQDLVSKPEAFLHAATLIVTSYIYIYIHEDAQVQWNSQRPLHYVFLLRPCQRGHWSVVAAF